MRAAKPLPLIAISSMSKTVGTRPYIVFRPEHDFVSSSGTRMGWAAAAGLSRWSVCMTAWPACSLNLEEVRD